LKTIEASEFAMMVRMVLYEPIDSTRGEGVKYHHPNCRPRLICASKDLLSLKVRRLKTNLAMAMGWDRPQVTQAPFWQL